MYKAWTQEQPAVSHDTKEDEYPRAQKTRQSGTWTSEGLNSKELSATSESRSRGSQLQDHQVLRARGSDTAQGRQGAKSGLIPLQHGNV